MMYKEMRRCIECGGQTDKKRCPTCQRVADKRFYITAGVIVALLLLWMFA